MSPEPEAKSKTWETSQPEAHEGTPMYHDGARQLQDRFDTRRLADCLEDVQVHEIFSDEDRGFIKSAPMFFLAPPTRKAGRIARTKGAFQGLFFHLTFESAPRCSVGR